MRQPGAEHLADAAAAEEYVGGRAVALKAAVSKEQSAYKLHTFIMEFRQTLIDPDEPRARHVSSFRRENHFVPEWYQKRFMLPNQGELFVLDKQPASWVVTSKGRVQKTKKAFFLCGPNKLMRLKNLYTVILMGHERDIIESRLFGRIDNIGAKACNFYSRWPFNVGIHYHHIPTDMGSPNTHFQNFLEYLDAQKLRTPKGLDWIKKQFGAATRNQNSLMAIMQRIRTFYTTMWAEGFWEIVSAENSSIKFILSDDPVTIYNCATFPGSKDCTYPYDPSIFHLGSRVIFPLDMNSCMIISHNDFARNPSREFATRKRRNSRVFDQTFIHTLHIHKSRHLSEKEVSMINYIIKQRAVRYVAAANFDWLCPEQLMESTHWPKLDAVLQHSGSPVGLWGGDILARFNDGAVLKTNEYGEHRYAPGPDYSMSKDGFSRRLRVRR